jgi:5-methylcytosine-specific restriction endonuclease McrA
MPECECEDRRVIEIFYPESGQRRVAECCRNKECLKRRFLTKKEIYERKIDVTSLKRVSINWFHEQHETQRKKAMEEFLLRREEKDKEWRALYNEHVTLMSPKWKDLRERVIRRDKNICQGCLMAPIEHVHHFTYANLGDELLYQLVGLCKKCHNKAHYYKKNDDNAQE